MRAETTVTIEVKPHHLFRYPSEWDPRQNGKTKGGYLEGQIKLPRTGGNLRVLLSTYPDVPHSSPDHNLTQAESEIHPTLLHVVRKGNGNRRYNSKEPVPSIQHWQQCFEVRGRKVYICNKTSENDDDRVPKISEKDEMFDLSEDMTLKIGKDAGELNLIILIPKTEKRANVNDVSLNKLLHSRTSSAAVLETLSQSYRGKKSVNLKKVKLKVEVFDLDTGLFLGSDITKAISDTASKAHGAMDLHDVTPLRSCARGGRKVVMLAEFGLAKDVEPKFLLYDSLGTTRLLGEEETLLRQPQVTDISIMRESIVFITPPQPQAETIRSRGYKVRLVARRRSDGYVSKKKFDFDYIPHDYYDPCFFCHENPDNVPGIPCTGQRTSGAKLVPMKEVARPGLRKRQMSEVDAAEYPERKTFKSEDQIRLENMNNRVPVIKTTQSSTQPYIPVTTYKKILPAPITLIPVSRLQVQSLKKIDPSNNVEKIVIKTEPPEEETDQSTASVIPFHDIANQTAIVRAFPVPVTTISSSLIFPTSNEIKKEL